MSDFALLDFAASGMAAQRAALDVAARNVAAAEAAGPSGSYEREEPVFAVAGAESGTPGAPVFVSARTQKGSSVDMITEMVSVMNASRAYEANTSVFAIGRRLAEQTIEMGRL